MIKYCLGITYVGKEFEMVSNHMLGGTGCPHCFGKFKKTTEQYKDEVEALYGDELLC